MTNLSVASVPNQTGSASGIKNFPQAILNKDVILSRRGTIFDITKLVEEKGLNSRDDIIFYGTDAVAIEQYKSGRPHPAIVLKVTREADGGLHELVLSGYSTDPKSKGKITSAVFKVSVQDN